MPGPLSIKYVNLHPTITFEQSSSLTGGQTQLGIDTWSVMPGDKLKKDGGEEQVVISETLLAAVANGDTWIMLGWMNPSTGYQFGVRINVPVQVLMMGHQPYYEVASGYDASPAWAKTVSNPAFPYTITAPDKERISILVSPTAHHTSLEIVATIQPKA